MTKFVHKTNSYCERYDCAKCPMRIGTMCFYEEQDYLQKRRSGKLMTEKQSCGHCKHLQIDGMFGIWCDIYNHDYVDIDAEKCPNYECGDVE